jgi:hypothetical protein
MAIAIRRLPAGFVIPAQPVLASEPPSGTDWFTKSNMTASELSCAGMAPESAALQPQRYDWTVRLSAIAAAAERIGAKSFTIDGEVV